ncbi:hypothetical protein ABZX77_40670 [Streptomyces sp. NPDC004237]|uniref:hypothetical protein n=1 Tax=Streptomyces sp. NPDC004237 TaxID=3154455 RepID=UPI0033B7EC69
MLTPRIGQVVLVPANPAVNNGADVAPAIITRVWSAQVINVRVLLDSDAIQWRTSVKYVDGLDGVEHPHAWTWPEQA